MPTEADTCRTYVTPRLKSAGREDVDISKQQHILGHLYGLYPSEHFYQVKLNVVRELESASGEKLSTLRPSMLRPQGGAFKGEL